MIFKNKRGDVNWYVVGLILALLILVITAVGPVRKLLGLQNEAPKQGEDSCRIFEGTCKAACDTGESENTIASASCVKLTPSSPKCCVPRTP